MKQYLMITFLRHGRPQKSDLILGQLDVPLDHYYSDHIKMLRGLIEMEGIAFDRIISSPLLRCRQTSTHLGYNPEIDPRVMEIYLGKLQGKEPSKELAQYYLLLDEYPKANWHDGETFTVFQSRVKRFYEEMNGDNVLVITHSGVIRTLLKNLLGITSKSFVPPYLGIYPLENHKIVNLFGRDKD